MTGTGGEGAVGRGLQVPADADQRELILTALDINLLVEAAAGTGKTTALVGRIVDKGVAIPTHISLLAVTSTRNATNCAVPISASDVPTAQMGEAAVTALLAKLDNPEAPPSRELFASPYVDRGSVVPPRPGGAAGRSATKTSPGTAPVRTKQARKQQPR